MAAKIRSLKPEFFQDDELFELERSSGLPIRLSYAGLWPQCDREGRFEWKPRFLKLQILPYDDVDFSKVLDSLVSGGFIVRYEVDGREYGWLPTFSRHQYINNRETDSKIPAPPVNDASGTRRPRDDDASTTRDERDGDAALSCTSGIGIGIGSGINTPLPPKGGGELPEVDESPKPSKSSRRHRSRDDDPPGFPVFYATFRQQAARKPAAEKYPAAVQKLVKTGKSPDEARAFLLARALEYAASVQDRPVDKTLLPSTWLNQERWNDALPQPASPQSAGPATNAMAQPSGWWKPSEPKPAPRFTLDEIETAESFLQKARSQAYHDGSRRCDVDSLRVWSWARRRFENDTRRPDILLDDLHDNLRDLAAGRPPISRDKITPADQRFAEGIVDGIAPAPCPPESSGSVHVATVGSRGAA